MSIQPIFGEYRDGHIMVEAEIHEELDRSLIREFARVYAVYVPDDEKGRWMIYQAELPREPMPTPA